MAQGEDPLKGRVYEVRGWFSWSDSRKLRFLRNLAETYGQEPRFRRWVIQDVLGGVGDRDYRGQAARLLSWVQYNVRYINEPGEQIQSPWMTMHLGYGDCLPEDTLLLRDDFEMVPISQIEPGQRIWGKDRWSTVEAVMEKGDLEVDRVHLSNGSSFEATPGHKVYAHSCEKHGPTCPDLTSAASYCRKAGREFTVERIHVSELREGMVMLVPERVAYGTGEMDSDRAYIEGLFLADGWSDSGYTTTAGEQKSYRFAISGRDGKPKEAQKRRVEAICERLGISTRWHERYIAVNDSEWAQRLLAFGRHAPNKAAPSLDLVGPCANALFEGLCADTGTSKTGTRVFTSTSRTLALQFRLLARMQGYTCGEEYIENHGGLGKHPIWRMNLRQARAGEPRFRPTRVKSIERAAAERPCWDIQTDDHYVYLPESDVTVSNCDDMAVLLASMAEAVAIPWRFVLSGRKNGKPVRWIEGTWQPWGVQWSHIYLLLGDRPVQAREWFPAEPTVQGAALGRDIAMEGGVSAAGVPEGGTMAGVSYGASPAGRAAAIVEGLETGNVSWKKVALDIAVGAATLVLADLVMSYLYRGRR